MASEIFAKLQPIPDTVTELLAVYKGNTIDNKMVVDVIGIKVGSDYHLIPCSPHLPCGFHSDGVCFGWCDLACGKTLIPVISDIFTTFTEAALYGNHFVIGVVLGTVDGRYKHRLVGFYHRSPHSGWRHTDLHQDILWRWFCQDCWRSRLLPLTVL